MSLIKLASGSPKLRHNAFIGLCSKGSRCGDTLMRRKFSMSIAKLLAGDQRLEQRETPH